MDNFITYKTSSPSGDLITFLSGIKQLWAETGKKAIVYQHLGMIGGSYEGANSAYGDEQDNPIAFNQYAFDMMKPLLLSQEYIEDYCVYSGQVFQIDLDKVRMEVFTNQPKGSLNRLFNYVYPQMASDLSKKWIQVNTNDDFKGKIIINFTERHRNHLMSYFFLNKHQDKIIFAGLEREYKLFCKEWNLTLIPLLRVNNFLELSVNINSCKFFLGNQSMCFHIAEALKIPRILELFPMIPNVIPVGEYAYDYYHQQSCEYYFNKLLNI